MITNPRDPAYPTPEFYDGKQVDYIPGLTIREYFAAIALQGLLAGKYPGFTLSELPRMAVKKADELIAELNKEQS